ncbi:hypothetical protein [Yersinia enterocolitica]|nr:hypothetical protein [Yersinia enterocolitica]
MAITDISHSMVLIATPDTTLTNLATVDIHRASERIRIKSMEIDV